MPRRKQVINNCFSYTEFQTSTSKRKIILLPLQQGRNNYDTQDQTGAWFFFSYRWPYIIRGDWNGTILIGSRFKNRFVHHPIGNFSIVPLSGSIVWYFSLVSTTRRDAARRDELSLYAVYRKGLSQPGRDGPPDASWNSLSIFIPNCDETNLVCYSLNGNKALALTKGASL